MNCMSLAVGDVEGRHFVGEVADGDAERVVVAEAGDVDAHRAAGVAVHVERDAGDGADLAERAVALVVEQEVLHRVVGDDDVDPAVVDRSRRTSRPATWPAARRCAGLRTCRPACFGDVGELAVAVVAIEIGERALEVLRPAVGPAAAGELKILAFVDTRATTAT